MVTIVKHEWHSHDRQYAIDLDEDLLSEIYPDLKKKEIKKMLKDIENGDLDVEEVIDEAYNNDIEIEWDFQYDDCWTDRKGGYDVTYELGDESSWVDNTPPPPTHKCTNCKWTGQSYDAKILKEGMEEIQKPWQGMDDISVSDKSLIFNTDLIETLEFDNLIRQSLVTMASAENRKESRGAHSREDFKERDDENWMKHTLAWQDGEKVKIDYRNVHNFTLTNEVQHETLTFFNTSIEKSWLMWLILKLFYIKLLMISLKLISMERR